ncbi:MAG: DUF4395 domain-containing protein [Pseudorhodobacter sp.]|nr:DUF4395 domain-containing protein [Pseudorhodobacter sp.]
MHDLTAPAPAGPIMAELPPASAMATTQDPSASVPAPAADVSAEAILARLQALEYRLTAELNALEKQGSGIPQAVPPMQAPSFLVQLASVVGSAPVVGFLLMLLLVLAVAAKGRPLTSSAIIRQSMATLHRLTAPAVGAVDQAQPAHGPSDNRQSPESRIYGQVITNIQPGGLTLRAGAFDENQVRAAAGLTLALGAVAFGYAAVGKIYLPIQIVTTLFFVEFLVRVTWGLSKSPLGIAAGWMTQRSVPQWVSAKPKRFAWSLGLVMSLAMMIITNSGIRGAVPMTICLICLTLMWLEAVLGLCLGCEIHRYLVRLGWTQPDRDFEICTNGSCTVEPQPQFAR